MKISSLLIFSCTCLLFVACSSKNESQKNYDDLSQSLIGTWMVPNSPLIEEWRTNERKDSTMAISYLDKENGDSVYLSRSVLFISNDKLTLEIYTSSGKDKVYHFTKRENNYLYFKSDLKDMYPAMIAYKYRPLGNILESKSEGIFESKTIKNEFKMYKFD